MNEKTKSAVIMEVRKLDATRKILESLSMLIEDENEEKEFDKILHHLHGVILDLKAKL